MCVKLSLNSFLGNQLKYHMWLTLWWTNRDALKKRQMKGATELMWAFCHWGRTYLHACHGFVISSRLDNLMEKSAIPFSVFSQAEQHTNWLIEINQGLIKSSLGSFTLPEQEMKIHRRNLHHGKQLLVNCYLKRTHTHTYFTKIIQTLYLNGPKD